MVNGARHRRARLRRRGFTYLWVVMAVAVLATGLLAVSEVWVTTARREKLAELDWMGAQFTQAIGSYYQAAPTAKKAYPPTLEELLEDHRYVTVRRHLREIYRNPFTGAADWELVTAPGGGILGVRAAVPGAPADAPREFTYQPAAAAQP
jgi:type II secretory pathway pseudopilin PulG